MRFKIASQTLACFALIAMSNFAYSAGYSPVLARLLSGQNNPGPTQPFSFSAQGVNTVASGVLDQTGNGGDFLNNNDSFESVLAFSDLRNLDGTVYANNGLGSPGYAAIVWSGLVSNVTNPVSGLFVGEIGQYGDADAANIKQRLSNLGLTDGAFAAVLTSESFDFNGATWDQINTEIGSSNVDLMGAFDLQAISGVTASAGTGAAVNYANTNFVLDVQASTVPAEMSWWQVEPAPVERVGDGGQLVVEANGNVGFLEVTNYVGNISGQQQALGGSQFALMNPVPEPSSLLAIAGCVGVAGFARRRRARK